MRAARQLQAEDYAGAMQGNKVRWPHIYALAEQCVSGEISYDELLARMAAGNGDRSPYWVSPYKVRPAAR